MSVNGDGGDAGRHARYEDENIRIRNYTDFLESDFGKETYKDLIKKMMENNRSRLVVSLDDLRTWDALRTQRSNGTEVIRETRNLLNNPMEHLPALDKALRDTVVKIDSTYPAAVKTDFHVALDGSFGAHALNPRTLSARYLGKLVSVEGIVTRCSLVRPKVIHSVHYCEKTNAFIERSYRDMTSPGAYNVTSSIYPTQDDEGNPLVTEYGLSTYRDYQTISIQEMPEKAPAGQLPRSVDITLDDDLVDLVKPGDRVQIIGVYRALPAKSQGTTNAIFKTTILANHIRHLGKEIGNNVEITEQDIQNIQKLAKRKNIFEILAQSLAPSIFGQESIKKALLLLLLGGVERNLPNGMHIRGDINLMMVGDPSTAKSQFLRFILNVAPLAIATTGRGASGVGLTAAVTHDRDTGDRRLEAGAMVLADRGVVCIDEFDKMSDNDRVAMHEVMEQQTVTIAKAGIHASLNARCSVVAAANPVYGQYNRQKKPTENIGLPDSLLSRFDLLFIVLDHMNPEHDKSISMHVLHMHQFRKAGEEEGMPTTEDVDLLEREDDNAMEEDTPIFEKYDHHYSGPGQRRQTKKETLTLTFLKKYLHFAKARYRPVLKPEAAEFIMNFYAELRNKEDTKTLPVTARTLETLIRLSTAHAKSRLSKTVDKIDAEAARDLMNHALFSETTVEKKRKRSKKSKKAGDGGEEEGDDEDGDDENDDDDDDDDDGDDKTAKRSRSSTPKPRAASSSSSAAEPQTNPKKRALAEEAQAEQEKDGEEDEDDAPLVRKRVTTEHRVSPSPDRIRRFQSILRNVFPRGVDTMLLDDLLTSLPDVPEDQGGKFKESEVDAILAVMESENKVMVRDRNIFLIS